MKLLATNTKLEKENDDYLVLGLSLAPSDASGVMNTCPSASKGCRKACLFTAGRGRMPNVEKARINKTIYFAEKQEEFMTQLVKEIGAAERKAFKLDKGLAVRLNVLSDVSWEDVLIDGKNVFQFFPNVTFYDYTKEIQRVRNQVLGLMPKNYSLTFSRSESNEKHVVEILTKYPKVNIAVVFRDTLPMKWSGRKVVDGDKSDKRFLDAKGVIVGLADKGLAKKDETGFVIG